MTTTAYPPGGQLLREWRARRRLSQLDLSIYPGDDQHASPAPTDVVVPLQLRHQGRQLSLFSIEAHVGTANDVTVDELTIEAFYPADGETKRALARGETGVSSSRPIGGMAASSATTN